MANNDRGDRADASGKPADPGPNRRDDSARDAMDGVEDSTNDLSRVARAAVGSSIELLRGGLRLLADVASDLSESGRRRSSSRDAESETGERRYRGSRATSRYALDLADVASRGLERTANTLSRAADRFNEEMDESPAAPARRERDHKDERQK